MLPFALFSFLAVLAVVLAALRFRGRFFAVFAGLLLGLHSLSATALYPHVGELWPLAAALQVSVMVHFASLIGGRLRSLLFRVFVSLPGHFFVGGTFLAIPWAVAAAVGLSPVGWFIPYLAALLGVAEGLFTRETRVDLSLDGQPVHGPRPRPYPRGKARAPRPLWIVQITDPHLGPWMSPARLRRIVQRAVDRAPDLIVLTGDFLTMESHAAAPALAWALAPLGAYRGRVFACRGNHDLEAPETVARALARADVHLLVDESALLETGAGPIQVLGIDYRFRDRRRHIEEVTAGHPRVPDALRLVLLHDPGAFRFIPEGDGDLVLSGHTHGGQVGFLSLGLPWTLLRLFSSIPDHGFWAYGRNRLYVHRGTGHYGFPLRVGVPAEQSLLSVHACIET